MQRWWSALQRMWDTWYIPFIPGGIDNFGINLAATCVVAVVVGFAMGPLIGLARWRVMVWLGSVLTPLAYTLSDTGLDSAKGCSIGLTPWEFAGALFATDTRTNVIMLIPAGAAAFLFPAGVQRLAALTAALCIPQPIELVQLVATHLGRSCQVFDVVNNMVGVMVGFWLVAGAVAVRESFAAVGSPPRLRQWPTRRRS